MSIQNPQFNEPGEHPGEAEGWTLVTDASLERIAGFLPEPHSGWETFGRWYEYCGRLDDCVVVLGLFGPSNKGFENFETAWGNDIYLTKLPLGNVVEADFGGSDIEAMGLGWDTESYAWELNGVATVTVLFDGEPVEVFIAEPFVIDWDDLTNTEAAFFNSGAANFESFDEVDWPEPEQEEP